MILQIWRFGSSYLQDLADTVAIRYPCLTFCFAVWLDGDGKGVECETV